MQVVVVDLLPWQFVPVESVPLPVAPHPCSLFPIVPVVVLFFVPAAGCYNANAPPAMLICIVPVIELIPAFSWVSAS